MSCGRAGWWVGGGEESPSPAPPPKKNGHKIERQTIILSIKQGFARLTTKKLHGVMIFLLKAFIAKKIHVLQHTQEDPPPPCLAHPWEDGPLPPPGGRLPSDGPPASLGEPHYHPPPPPRVNGPGHVSYFERGGPLARGAMFFLSKGGGSIDTRTGGPLTRVLVKNPKKILCVCIF